MNIGNFPEFPKNNIENNKNVSCKKHPSDELVKSPRSKEVCDKTPLDAAAFGILINPVKAKKPEPSQAEKHSFLLQSEVTPSYAEKISKLEGREWERAAETVKRGNIADSCIERAVKIDDDYIFECVNDLIDTGFNDSHVLFIAGQPEFLFKYYEYKDLYNKGYDINIIGEIAGQKAEQLKNTDRIINLMKSKPDFDPDNLRGVSCFCDADETVMQRAEELINMNIKDLFSVHDIATGDEAAYKKDTELLKRGYQAEGLHDVSELKGTRAEKADKLIKKYNMINYHAALYSEAYDDVFSRIGEIKELDKYDEIQDSVYSYILKFDEQNYLAFKNLINEGYDFNTYFNDGIINNSILEEKIQKYTEESKNNERIWKNFLNNSPNAEKYKNELTSDDVFFLKQNAFNSKYYTPEEYTDTFLYFKNLKTPQGQSIMNCEEFFDKIPDDKEAQKYQKPLFYNNIKQLMSLKPGSVEASYIQTCLDLIREGSIHPSAIRKLSPDNSLKLKENGISADENYSIHISDEMKSDIDVLYESVINNEGKTKEEIDKLITDNYVSTYSDEEEAMRNAKAGDVYNIDGEKFVRIKTSETDQQPLKITKETYTKLFPPYERFASSQQVFGDCYCIESLMNLYSDKDSRALLLSMFEENDNGDIKVKIKDYPSVTFKNGEFPANEDEKNYSGGAKGFRLLEYAYAEALVQDEINTAFSKLDENGKKEFKQFMSDNPDNFFIYNGGEKPQIMTYSEAKKTGLYKKAGNIYKPNAKEYDSFKSVLLGNGGLEYNVFKKFGLQPELYYTGSDKVMAGVSKQRYEKNTAKRGIDIEHMHRKIDLNEFLNQPGLFENNKVMIGISAHAYGLSKADDGFYIYNPHNQAFPVKVNDLSRMKQKGMITSITLIPKTDIRKTAA